MSPSTSNLILAVGMAPRRRSDAILTRGTELTNLRPWERMTMTNTVRTAVVAQWPGTVNATASRMDVFKVAASTGQSQLIGVRAPLAGRMGGSSNRRTPAKIMPPILPRVLR
jgi:hypothetical protein